MSPGDGFYVCPWCQRRFTTNAAACACTCDKKRVHQEF